MADKAETQAERSKRFKANRDKRYRLRKKKAAGTLTDQDRVDLERLESWTETGGAKPVPGAVTWDNGDGRTHFHGDDCPGGHVADPADVPALQVRTGFLPVRTESETALDMEDNARRSLSGVVTLDPAVLSARETAARRVLDAWMRGEAACTHRREDGLGLCGEPPEVLAHATDNAHGHPFHGPTVEALAVAKLPDCFEPDWSRAKPDEILEDISRIVATRVLAKTGPKLVTPSPEAMAQARAETARIVSSRALARVEPYDSHSLEEAIQDEMEAARNGPETDPEAFRREREGSGAVDHPAFQAQAHALPTPDDFGRWLQAFLNKAAPYADGADIQGAVKMGTDEILAAYDRAKPGGNFSAKATVRRNQDGSATVLDVEVTPLPDPEPASPPDSVQRWVICVKKGETVYAVCSNRRGVLMPFRLHAIPPNYWVYSTKDIHEAAKVARWVRKLTPGTVETLPSLVLAKLMEMETAQAEDRMVAELPVPRVEGCKRCGKPLAYPGAVYCGAACTAQAEAGE